MHPTQLEIGNQLRFMNRDETLNGFKLDYNAVIDNQIDAVTAIQPHSFVLDRQLYL